ncbi:hypothetical protein PPYR_08834 [Photinus pyralis]|uniref:Multidrug resistance-associated protein lethal(2)03659 n=1 Tax=Photinus pyralis TaxID=7054 RepID=A0A5N4AKK1_PHOPY|nr:multidrug resistance-associated protein 4-like [Photinus pyralis]KAB0797841.1 hypothetical protein PPYR_08834 [Photinus pyralis]
MDLGLYKTVQPNPREDASIFSIATMWYTIPTFLKGRKRDLEVSDLHQTYSKHKSKLLGDKIEAIWLKEQAYALKSKKQPSLKRVLIKMFGFDFVLLFIFCLVMEFAGRTLQPLLLGQLVDYYKPGQTSMTKTEAYGFAGGVVACSLLQVLITTPYMTALFHIGMKMRVACCSLLYRKALKLSQSALGETTIGQMVNLLSNDVNRFDTSIIFAQYLVVAPLQVIVATYFMYQEVGISAVIGVVVLLLFVPLQYCLARLIAKFRYKTAYKTDERVRLMNEVVSGIQVIKMYTWEKPFAKFVALARRAEIKFIRGVSFLRGIIMSFFIFSSQVCLFVTILAYIYFGEQITAKKVFVLTAFYNVIRLNMCNLFAQAVAQVSEAKVSIKRLNEFLVRDEKPPTPLHVSKKAKQNGNANEFSTEDESNYAIEVCNGEAKWNDSYSESTFENLNIKIKPGSVVAVIGPVGSGKSSLLQLILKELPLRKGSLKVDGRVSYASQEPWIFTGSVRQNILFNKTYHKFRYKHVVNKCSLIRDFTLLANGDKTVVGDRGVSLSGGQRARINLARAIYEEADIYLLDDPLSAVDTHVGKDLFDKCINGYLKGKTVLLVTHQLQFLKDVDSIIILENGTVKAQGTFDELQESGLDFAKLLKRDDEKEEETEELARPAFINRSNSIMSVISTENQDFATRTEEITKGTVSLDIYKSYISAGANWFFIICVIGLFLATQLSSSFGDVFISKWVTAEEGRLTNATTSQTREPDDFWSFSTETYVYTYSGITVATVVLTLTRSMSYFTACMRSSVNLHDNMFNSIIRGTMRFFNTNPSGRILNRFAKDMGAIDELLPTAMLDYVQLSLMVLGIIGIISSVNPWLLIPTVVIGVIFYFIRKLYLTISRSVKRLEGITRSPVFGHLNATLQGLTTIRSIRAESTLIEEFDNLQDLHSVAWFLFISTSRAFAYWLDLICVIYICLVTFSFLIMDDSISGGNVGLAITQSLGLVGIFQWTIRQSAEMENQMTAVERVLEYNKIEHERTVKSEKLPESWPEKGEVKFVDVYLNYFLEDPPVLKHLSFHIKPLEKVGIVGRTGAGKSSLINALFQLTNTEGQILIDGIDIGKMKLHDLRAKISIIPQEPVLFSGNMRKNLDPFDEYSDEALWKALEDVELKSAIAELNLGLNSVVTEGGSNYSVGQRQLICLARAILRNNKVLILDEATANVDPQTDALIQKTIRKQFSQCTVLTIAHRLNTVMDSDKILVMDAGTAVQFDHPYTLLQNEKGIFYGMVLQTGPAMTETLTKVAKESYERTLTNESN